MNVMLEPRKNSLLIRIACLVLILGFSPFAIIGLHKEGTDYGIVFFVAFLICLLPEIIIKLFLKPVSAELEKSRIVLAYYFGIVKRVDFAHIKGYSETQEYTNYGEKKGLLLYLKDGQHLDFTEINIRNIGPLANYLEINHVPYYGSEKMRPWFSSKYEYDQ